MRWEPLFLFLVASILCWSARAQHLSSRTNIISLKTEDGFLKDSGHLPVIRWISPDLEFTYSAENRITVRASVTAMRALMQSRLVIGNNRDGTVISEKKLPVVPEQQTYEISQEVRLPDGNIYIAVEVTTASGVVISDRRNIYVGKDAMEDIVSLDRKDYALIFATDKYDNWTDLVNPINDAEAIAKELKDQYGFDIDIVTNPTTEQIWQKLRDYNERKFGPQDQLFVFFAGHGHYDESFGEGYVVTKNSLSNDLSRNSYISHNRLRGVINNINCNHIFLTMDVCFGGTLDPLLASRRGATDAPVLISEMLIRKWAHRTRKYLTSGGKEYVLDGVPGKHSPFASKFLECLKSGGGDDRVMTLSEFQVAFERMKQLPRFGSFGDDEPLSDFVFINK